MQSVVVRFVGDSGDGMQLTGNLFSSLSAILGDEISTFPDFPAEIRAPQGTLGGVSGFQVHLGKGVYTPGDKADVLVAMNAAALKVNVNHINKHSIVICDTDSFTDKDLEKAQYTTDNPFTELQLPESVQIVPVPLTTLTKESLHDSGLDLKAIVRSKNMFALGLVCWLFDRPIDHAISFLEDKFKKKPALIAPNVKVLSDGYNYGQNLALSVNQIRLEPSAVSTRSSVRHTSIAGNKATAWGLIAAAEKAGKQLFLGSYPITPATDILHELSARKDCGVITVQAEDEIAGICTALGASFAGDLGVTSTSGPGLSLKSEAIGLAVMAELPLVVIDVQRGGPSTGLPTKTEQTDLLQALYGRNGECPAAVIAASTPANCFHYAYMAAKIALENMTPVILLSDTYLANGTSVWNIPEMQDLPRIRPQSVPDKLSATFNPAMRDERGVRYWAYPGMEGYCHRNIGLERDAEKGTISTDPLNHEQMVRTRAAKVAQIADSIPLLQAWSPDKKTNNDLALIGWGSTEGHLKAAATELGCDVVHFNYINPLPRNTQEVLGRYKRLVVCELNSGQFAAYLRTQMPQLKFKQFNRIEGQPFQVEEIVKELKIDD
ncbi:MAG: 2-oxoacid:acceptor oxidoreductase subunit alpha [Paludibacteraceae bacterium]|nr:2-oxoacid:acceptor oxidoreductase subunit alpha [Paludibacteraceae bacterium]